MPSNPPDVTQIPAPRVDFIDKRTGLMAREWYRFFVNIYNLAGGGNSSVSLDDLQVGQVGGGSLDSIAEMMKTLQELELQPPVVPSSGTGTTYSVFTSTTNGLAPASGGGTTNYLRADGTWDVPPGTGGVTFANPTASVGPTATNGTAVTAMRSDAAPAINLTANYTFTGQWTFSRTGTTSALQIYANSTNWQCVAGFSGSAEFLINAVSFSGAPSIGLAVGNNRYLQVTAGNVDIQLGATLTVASTSVRDGAILTSGTVAAARLPSFGTAAAGIVPASGGGTTNFLRADGTWAVPSGGGGTTVNTGSATINFGTAPGSNEASVAVTGLTTILATSKVQAWVMADDTSVDHTASDHRYFPALAALSCGTPTAGTGFTIYGRSTQKLTGAWTVRYLWVD
jgi:hypothetical protein